MHPSVRKCAAKGREHGHHFLRRLLGPVDRLHRVGVEPEEPRPDRSLMVRAVSFDLSATVERLIGWVVRGERPQPDGGEELVSHRCKRPLLVGLVDRYAGQRESPKLIRSQLSVGVSVRRACRSRSPDLEARTFPRSDRIVSSPFRPTFPRTPAEASWPIEARSRGPTTRGR